MVPWHTPQLDRSNPKLSAPIRNFRFFLASQTSLERRNYTLVAISRKKAHLRFRPRHHPRLQGGKLMKPFLHHSAPFLAVSQYGFVVYQPLTTRNCTSGASVQSLLASHLGFSCGNRITSRMLSWPRSIMQRRSIPRPMPPAGGMPCSSAIRKSSSSFCFSPPA